MSRKVFDTEDQIQLTATFSDPDTDELVNPDTVDFIVRKPDATTSTPSVTHVSLGTYRVTVTPAEDEYGRWHYRAHGTGQVQAAQERYFVVRKSQVI